MENHPLVSVIIPLYNYENYIKIALNSVFEQSYRPIEVIVVDDGSTDNSAAIVRTYQDVRYYYQTNQSAAVARNNGIAVANGEFIAYLDADDLWHPEKLSIQVSYMVAHLEVDITTTSVLSFLEPETQIPAWFNPDRELGETNGIVLSAMVVRKNVFDQVGGFSTAYVASEDTEWLCRAKDAGISIVTIPKPLTLKRLHGSNLTWPMISTAAARSLRIFRESIARKSHNRYFIQ
uniref:Glycosyl transferase family 2 n=1 Tax=Cyanothece sp. (strain PCC 7425 / ATCC 29141) TaxID=395961 RepID=B8HPX1_CYAP4